MGRKDGGKEWRREEEGREKGQPWPAAAAPEGAPAAGRRLRKEEKAPVSIPCRTLRFSIEMG
jgi:hypothetical protein